MPASPKLGFHLLQLRPQPLFDGDAPEPEAPVPGLPANVGEAQEIERFGPSESSLLSLLGGEPPELDQSRLLRRQLQAEFREPAAKVGQE